MPEDQATQQLAELIGRITQLPSQNLEPPQFFANFLQLTVAATGSHGGAIWLIQPGKSPQCYCHIELEATGINSSEQQQQLIVQALQKTVEEVKTLILPAANCDWAQLGSETDNQSAYHFFFKPLRAAQQVAMVLQLIGKPDLQKEQCQLVLGLLNQVAEAAETYLAHRRAAVLEDDRKSLARLLQFTEGVYESLDPQYVAQQVANLGRDAVGCERLVVWIDPRIKRGLQAVSGIDKPDRRAVLLQAISKLGQYCLEIKKPIVASREQLPELPEEDILTQLLKNYFNVSQLNQIYIEVIKGKEDDLGAIMVEGFDEQANTNMAGVISTISKHAANALENALKMASVPMVRPFAKLKDVKKDPKKRRKFLITLGVLALLIVVAALLPWPIKVSSPCELTPAVLRRLDAPLDGVQVKEIKVAGGPVESGQLIVQLDDTELQTSLFKLEAQHEQENINKSQLRGEKKSISELELQRIKHEMDLVNLQIEKCKIRSPISGMILTPQNEMKLLEGITVQKGASICEIADLSHWQLVLDVPQEEIGWVQRGLSESAPSVVQFYMAAYPKYKLEAQIGSIESISQLARIKDDGSKAKGNVYEVRIDIPPAALEAIQAGLRPGSKGQAKITTCKRPLGYVLLRKVIRFFRVTFF